MKKIIFTSLATLVIFSAFCQNYLAGPIGLYGPQYADVTNIASGGSIMVGTSGSWTFGGNIVSTDKGNGNAPTALGRSQIITFDGTGTYNGASTVAGTAGYVIDGYAQVSNQTSSFLLPIGTSAAAYPVMVPAGLAVTAAYFAGNGSSQNAIVAGNSSSTTEYSPYIDMPNGFAAGSYTFSYPAGFSSSSYSSILSSGNSSASGTSYSTTYSWLKNVANFNNSASTTTATLSSSTATQIYFATSLSTLPIRLLSFTGSINACKAKLIWQSTTEINSKYYDVEISKDAMNYMFEGRVNSQNNLTGAVYNYTYALIESTNFFRLKMVDNDGKFSYSNIVALTGTGNCSAGAKVFVYPNPTNNFINISGLPNGGNRLKLFNLEGKKILEIISKNSYQQMDIRKLAKGLYMLSIEDLNGSVKSFKIAKQ